MPAAKQGGGGNKTTGPRAGSRCDPQGGSAKYSDRLDLLNCWQKGEGMRYRSTIVAVFMLLMIVGRPAGAGEGFEVMGLGTDTCATFAKAYQNAAIPADMENLYFTWAQGYLSRFNMVVRAKDHNARDLSALPPDAQKAWIREYCSKNPLSYHYQSALQLFGKLPWKDTPK
jgi:hypothetical protein